MDFSRRLMNGDRVAVYPRFWSIELPFERRLAAPLSRPARFVADIHLGKLVAGLRLAGFDVLRVADDAEAASIAARTSRGVLTRDRDLLKRNAVRVGRWIRHTDPDDQLVEALEYFDLAGDVQPFTRCLRCNGVLEPVRKTEVVARLPPRTRTRFDDFHRCPVCGRLYWQGSHFERLRDRLNRVLSRVR